MLYIFIDGAVDLEIGEAIPYNIRKTLSFIDSRTRVANIVKKARSQLVDKTKHIADLSKRYIQGKGPSVNVEEVVLFYTSYVTEHNQNLRYQEFKKLDSKIRIIIATTALSTGINIVDIKFIFQQGFSRTRDIEDILQRLGRSSRALLYGEKSIVFLFLLYYIDNREKDVLEGSQAIVPRIPATIALRNRSRLSSKAAMLGKDAGSDVDDIQTSLKRIQTKSEIEKRENIPTIFRLIQNKQIRHPNKCFRIVVKTYLGEALSLYPLDETVAKEDCYNMYNPLLYATLPEVLES